MILVVDASVAVEYLLRSPVGRAVARRLSTSDLVAPELLDAEVLAVVRRAYLQQRIAETRAREVLGDLQAWPLRRLPNVSLLRRAWQYRHKVSAYDALYLAAAASMDAPLLTADGPLARAPLAGVVVEIVRC